MATYSNLGRFTVTLFLGYGSLVHFFIFQENGADGLYRLEVTHDSAHNRLVLLGGGTPEFCRGFETVSIICCMYGGTVCLLQIQNLQGTVLSGYRILPITNSELSGYCFLFRLPRIICCMWGYGKPITNSNLLGTVLSGYRI